MFYTKKKNKICNFATITNNGRNKMNQNSPQLLDLDNVICNKAPKLYKKIPRFVLKYLKRKIHQDELNEILTIYKDDMGVDFMTSIVGYFKLNLVVEGLEKLPSDGRFVFASNHPLGGLDGICLSSIVGAKFEKKIKYPVNDLLLNIRNLKPIFVPVNKHGTQSKSATNLLQEAFDSDNQIITFPAGLCSRQIGHKIEDLEWKKTVITKAIETKRNVVPVHFEGYNSKFFYKFAVLRKRLGIKFNIEMLFLPDEMFKNKNKTFTIIFGEPIAWETFDKSKTIKEWTEYVRAKSYSLIK